MKGISRYLVFPLVVLTGLGTACSFDPPSQNPADSNSANAKHDSGKAVFEEIESDMPPDAVIRLLGTPNEDLEVEMGVWPSYNMTLWFDKAGIAQVYAPAFKFEYLDREAYTGTLDIEYDAAFDQKVMAEYITAGATVDEAIAEFGEPQGGGLYRVMYWDFPNGDRITVLFSGLYNFDREQWVFDYKLANLDRSDMPGQDGEWDFLAYVPEVPEPETFAVVPKMLWTARGGKAAETP